MFKFFQNCVLVIICDLNIVICPMDAFGDAIN